MTFEETGMVLAILQEAYPNFYKGISGEDAIPMINLWNEMFADHDARTVTAAVKALIVSDTKGFPPTIGQVMEKIRLLTQPREMTEAEAWAIVHKAIRNSAYNSQEEFEKLPPEIQSVVHDPEQLKAWAIDPHFNLGVESSNFKRSYRARAAQLREFNALPESVKQFAISAGGGMDLDRHLLPAQRNGGAV